MGNSMAWNPPTGLVSEGYLKDMTTRESYPLVERREILSSDDFFSDYVAKSRPVVVSGALKHCAALSRWSFNHLHSVSGQRVVKLKQGLIDEGVAGLKTVDSRLGDYLEQLESHESLASGSSRKRPPYLHDVPLLGILPDAEADLEGFPVDYFPLWYRATWLRFAQFFLGPRHSLTPLHFDCLLTHNLFFQVTGRKRFILLQHDQLPYCYRYRWRWCAVDAEKPDFASHPLYREAQIQECIVEPGDMLYMPPGMLHHVRGLDTAISFNVDWHTRDSAIRGVLALGRGMPLKNVYYNLVLAIGLWGGISTERILPWYRSYLNYVS
ncbi:MAG: cupin-like domain-containing protein [Methylococcaceae bacterium]|nr:cupin-like domain-containing protein [Methylococcaceae bacterium]